MSTPLHNVYWVNNQIFPTYEFLVVQSMYQLHPHNVSKWVGIYVGFDSPSIIRYLEPLTGDVSTVYFVDCHFNESVFPPLGGEKSVSKERREITCNSSTMSHFDPCTNQCELEV